MIRSVVRFGICALLPLIRLAPFGGRVEARFMMRLAGAVAALPLSWFAATADAALLRTPGDAGVRPAPLPMQLAAKNKPKKGGKQQYMKFEMRDVSVSGVQSSRKTQSKSPATAPGGGKSKR